MLFVTWVRRNEAFLPLSSGVALAYTQSPPVLRYEVLLKRIGTQALTLGLASTGSSPQLSATRYRFVEHASTYFFPLLRYLNPRQLQHNSVSNDD